MYWESIYIKKASRDKPGGSIPIVVGCCASKIFQSALPVEVEDGEPYDSKDTRDNGGLEKMAWEWSHRLVPPKRWLDH